MHKVHGRIMLTYDVHLLVKENRPITPELIKGIKKLVSQELNLRIADSSLGSDLPISDKKGFSVERMSPEIKISLDKKLDLIEKRKAEEAKKREEAKKAEENKNAEEVKKA
jgi:hypothetical protein